MPIKALSKYKIKNNKEKKDYQTIIRELIKNNIADVKKSREVLSCNMVNIVMKFMNESAIIRSGIQMNII